MKKTLASLSLLAALNPNGLPASEALFKVSQEIHQEASAIFAQKKDDAALRFEKLVELADQIKQLNEWLSQNQHLAVPELNVLSIVNGVLDFTFYQFKQKYESQIYAIYTQEFRQFASQRSALKSYLKQLRDQIYGVQLVEVEGLTLTTEDLSHITQKASAFEEALRNAS